MRDLTLLLKQVKAFLSTQRIQPASELRILPRLQRARGANFKMSNDDFN